MHIKKVNIQGFKSYRDSILTEDFDPKLNVIVGRNGSGKSNFFLAIQFVLSDDFGHLKMEEKQQILHEGFGASSQTAFVEIVFDNSDGRIPIDKDEVSVRRIVGLKDQYFVDKKLVTKQDVMNLLESSGLSNSNPYYIVKQGKINELATCKDSERLRLLKEIAGARTYDERREESEKILLETLNKRQKIDELLSYIIKKLDKLEAEKCELNDFMKLNQEHKDIKNAIEAKKNQKIKNKIIQLENERGELSKRLNETQDQICQEEEKIAKLRSDLASYKCLLMDQGTQIESLQNDMSLLQDKRSNLEVILKDTEDVATFSSLDISFGEIGTDGSSSRYPTPIDLSNLEEEIRITETSLLETNEKYEKITKSLAELEVSLEEAKKRRFKHKTQHMASSKISPKEKCEEIETEIRELNSQKSEIERQILHLNDVELLSLENEKASLTADISLFDKSTQQLKEQLKIEESSLNQIIEKRDSLCAERREVWRRESSCSNKRNLLVEDISRLEDSYRAMWPKAVTKGIDSLKKIQKNFSHTIKGTIYGTVLENFKCDERFYLCIDVIGGNKLCNVIVDTDVTAAEILRELNNHSLPGELTFLPLNKIQVKPSSFPQTQDAVPLLKRLRYDEKLNVAFQLCFDRTLICKNFDVACNLSKTHGIDCVTMDGDQSSGRGLISGGYINPTRSRVKAYHVLKQKRESLNEIDEEMRQIKHQLNLLDNELVTVENQSNKCSLNVSVMSEQLQRNFSDRNHSQHRLEMVKKELLNKQFSLTTLRNSVHSINLKMNTLMIEKQEWMSPDERPKSNLEKSSFNNLIKKFDAEIDDLTQKVNSLIHERKQIESQKVSFEHLLSLNLYKRRDEISKVLSIVDNERNRNRLESTKHQLFAVESNIANVNSSLKDLLVSQRETDELHEQVNVSLNESESLLNSYKTLIATISQQLSEVSNRIDVFQKKISAEISDKTCDSTDLNVSESICETSTSELSINQLMDNLNSINIKLKEYGHVNRKAFDQYIEFSEQKQNLIIRQAELQKSHEAITNMMAVLEERKNEAVLFTFRQVSKNFSEIFQHLVPHGRATLIMKRSVDTVDDSSVVPTTNVRESSVETFSGVAIKASFFENSSKSHSINQLSGGQKTLVALTLIFAIQRCDPAPFYLFDEIDQALDPTHRSAVARTLNVLSEKAQFIVTSFRSELLQHAQKFFGVQFRNRVSRLLPIDKEQAEQFVTMPGQTNEEIHNQENERHE